MSEADYYRKKEEEARDIQRRIKEVKARLEALNLTLRDLEKKLEAARYVGD